MPAKLNIKQLADDWQLTVDPEFAKLCRPLAPQERSLLQADIKQRGCLDDIVVWRLNGNRMIVDGHHRHEICRWLRIEFGVRELSFKSRAEALAWIADHQTGRRNITPEEAAYLRGRRYLDQKQPHGGDRKSDPQSSGNGCHLNGKPKAAGQIAVADGVSERTVRNDAQFARAVDTIASNAGDQARGKILAGELGSRRDVVQLAELPPAQQKALVEKGKPVSREAIAKHTTGPTLDGTPEGVIDGKKLGEELSRVRRAMRPTLLGVPACRRVFVAKLLIAWLEEFVEKNQPAPRPTNGGRKRGRI